MNYYSIYFICLLNKVAYHIPQYNMDNIFLIAKCLFNYKIKLELH